MCVGRDIAPKLQKEMTWAPQTGPCASWIYIRRSRAVHVTGIEVRFQTITDEEYRELCRRDQIPEHIIDILTSMYRAAEAQEFSSVTTDLKLLTNQEPESITRLLSRTIAKRKDDARL